MGVALTLVGSVLVIACIMGGVYGLVMGRIGPRDRPWIVGRWKAVLVLTAPFLAFAAFVLFQVPEIRWILLVIALLAVLMFVGRLATAKQQRIWEDLGIPQSALLLEYEGGHPELPSKGAVRLWGVSDMVRIVQLKSPFTKNASTITIPMSDIVTLSLDHNVQHVGVGGGRSIGGALLGGVLAGPIGAIIGGRSSDEVKRFDESKTHLVMRYRGIQLHLIFNGGDATYNKLSRVFAPSNAVTST